MSHVQFERPTESCDRLFRLSRQAPALAWNALVWDAWSLGVEASAVIAMRMTKICMGDSGASSEMTLMTSEKISAAMELGVALLGDGTGRTPLASGQRAVKLYRGKVAANRRRLARERRGLSTVA